MKSLVVLLLATAGHAPQPEQMTCVFETGRFDIQVTVDFQAPYLGRRLTFYNSLDPRKEVCYAAGGETSMRCVEHFVGAVATVQYSVRRRNSKSPGRIALRELVTVIAQSDGLPDRPPYSKSVPLVNGIGSDIQVFGYDEGEVDEPDRIRTRDAVRESVWRVFRQALYIDDDPAPFAILEWRHTIDRITLIRH